MKKTTTNVEGSIIWALANGPMAPQEIAAAIGKSIENTRVHLSNMKKKGLVEKTGKKYQTKH